MTCQRSTQTFRDGVSRYVESDQKSSLVNFSFARTFRGLPLDAPVMIATLPSSGRGMTLEIYGSLRTANVEEIKCLKAGGHDTVHV
jgi:hypothetical protein